MTKNRIDYKQLLASKGRSGRDHIRLLMNTNIHCHLDERNMRQYILPRPKERRIFNVNAQEIHSKINTIVQL